MEKAERYYNELGQWTKEAFSDAGSVEHLRKLHEETDEAIECPEDISEYADCLGAIFGAAYKQGFSFEQLLNASFDKLEINKSRKWQKLPDGTYRHI